MGFTKGEKGPELAAGAGMSAGIDFQVFITNQRTAEEFGGWNRNYSFGVGPLSYEYGVSPTGQWTHSFGLGPGKGGGFWSYNEYTWVW
jgi:hypothetical protein